MKRITPHQRRPPLSLPAIRPLPAICQATPGGTPRVFDGRGDASQDHALPRASGRATRRRRQHATGFTLLEVVLALTIFFGSIAVLSQINWNGTRAAVQSRLKAQATLLCESKLQEVLVGAEPLSDQSNVAFEDDSNWTWSLTSTATSLPDLIMVEVTVSRDVPGGLGSVSQSLRRWMRDPSLFNSGGL
jgi:general secretion pathway protein I